MNPVFSEIKKAYPELTYDPVAKSLKMGNTAVAYESGPEFKDVVFNKDFFTPSEIEQLKSFLPKGSKAIVERRD